MNDRELLEMAAKAAGYRLEWDGHPDQWQPIYYEGKTYHSFNPLTDDGDALRLAVKLGISVMLAANNIACSIPGTDDYAFEEGASAEHARRAIVRAAAEIGRGME